MIICMIQSKTSVWIPSKTNISETKLFSPKKINDWSITSHHYMIGDKWISENDTWYIPFLFQWHNVFFYYSLYPGAGKWSMKKMSNLHPSLLLWLMIPRTHAERPPRGETIEGNYAFASCVTSNRTRKCVHKHTGSCQYNTTFEKKWTMRSSAYCSRAAFSPGTSCILLMQKKYLLKTDYGRAESFPSLNFPRYDDALARVKWRGNWAKQFLIILNAIRQKRCAKQEEERERERTFTLIGEWLAIFPSIYARTQWLTDEEGTFLRQFMAVSRSVSLTHLDEVEPDADGKLR